MTAAIAAFTIILTGGPAFAASTADEIRAALVGNTFQGGMGGGDYTSYFGEDGVYKDKDGSGQYTVDDKGVCYPGSDFGCYQATIDGDKLEWSKDGKVEGSGTILKGNPLEF